MLVNGGKLTKLISLRCNSYSQVHYNVPSPNTKTCNGFT